MDNKPFIVKSHDIHLDEDYRKWINEIKERYRNAQIKAAVKVNYEQLLFNWEMGRDLVTRRAEEKWGKGVVEQVSLDLQDAFPNVKGFSARNLWFMKQWYLFYASEAQSRDLISDLTRRLKTTIEKLNQIGSEMTPPKLNQVGSEFNFPLIFSYVPWRHHVLIVQRCKSVEEALFYIERTIENGWSRNSLENNIGADLYHKSGNAVSNFSQRLAYPQSKLAQELTKENYDLGFITLPDDYDEKALEDEIEHHITRFLLELGKGWAFVGRQKELVVGGRSRKIDLLFYHIPYRFYMVVELKAKPFEPEFAGKLNFYVNAVNNLMRTDTDNPTVGLLICKSMNRMDVQWALEGINNPMGVATYNNVKIEEIKEQLPSTEDIETVVKNAEEEYKRRKRRK